MVGKKDNAEEVFDRAVMLAVEENDTDAVEVSFHLLKERENFRVRLYRQKRLFKEANPEMAEKIKIAAITDRKKKEFKIQLSYCQNIEIKIVSKEGEKK